MDLDANFCPILGSFHSISDSNRYKKEKGEGTQGAFPPVVCSRYLEA